MGACTARLIKWKCVCTFGFVILFEVSNTQFLVESFFSLHLLLKPFMELKFRTETETRVQWLYYGCTHKLWRIIHFAPAFETTNNLEKSIAIKYYKNQQIVTNMKWGNDMVALFVICHMYIYLCLSSIIVVEYSDDDDDGDYTMSNSLWSFFRSTIPLPTMCCIFVW